MIKNDKHMWSLKRIHVLLVGSRNTHSTLCSYFLRVAIFTNKVFPLSIPENRNKQTNKKNTLGRLNHWMGIWITKESLLLVFELLSLQTKSYGVTIQMKLFQFQQYFHMVLITRYIALSFGWQKKFCGMTTQVVLSYAAICFSIFDCFDHSCK